MAVRTSAGSTLKISAGVPATFNVAGYADLTYTTIGEITKIEPSTDGLFKTGEVRLDERLSGLTEVTVLVPINREEF